MDARNNLLLLEIAWDVEGVFVERPNRFLGIVEITAGRKKQQVEVHVHDPGRLPDILIPGKKVRLKYVARPGRKTKWDLIAGKTSAGWVLVHSGYHRKICENLFRNEAISPFNGVTGIVPEVKVGKSRIDFLLERKDSGSIWVEIKGCTLAKGQIATFPDAPTLRGSKHVEELISIRKRGSDSAIVFLVFRPEATCFLPNKEMDSLFDKVFREALGSGVEARFLVLEYVNGGVYFKREIPLCSFLS